MRRVIGAVAVVAVLLTAMPASAAPPPAVCTLTATADSVILTGDGLKPGGESRAVIQNQSAVILMDTTKADSFTATVAYTPFSGEQFAGYFESLNTRITKCFVQTTYTAA